MRLPVGGLAPRPLPPRGPYTPSSQQQWPPLARAQAGMGGLGSARPPVCAPPPPFLNSASIYSKCFCQSQDVREHNRSDRLMRDSGPDKIKSVTLAAIGSEGEAGRGAEGEGGCRPSDHWGEGTNLLPGASPA